MNTDASDYLKRLIKDIQDKPGLYAGEIIDDLQILLSKIESIEEVT